MSGRSTTLADPPRRGETAIAAEIEDGVRAERELAARTLKQNRAVIAAAERRAARRHRTGERSRRVVDRALSTLRRAGYLK